jgi:hypothetical protein
MDHLHYIPFPVEGLYCKRPIQCLASSEILTPHRPAVCTPLPPPLVRGEDTLAWGRGGGGVNSLEDARHCSVLYICKYFVPLPHLPISLVVHRHNVQEHRVALLWTQPGEACTQSWEHSSKKRGIFALYIPDFKKPEYFRIENIRFSAFCLEAIPTLLQQNMIYTNSTDIFVRFVLTQNYSRLIFICFNVIFLMFRANSFRCCSDPKAKIYIHYPPPPPSKINIYHTERRNTRREDCEATPPPVSEIFLNKNML